MADYLPAPLVTEILSRLPAKSLLRFRCVSKTWKSLIDGPNLIKVHLKNSLQNTTNHTIILRHFSLFYLGFPTLNQVKEINHPLKSDCYGTEVVGSCNGLLCLSNGEEQGIEGTIIYNPVTKKSRELPVSPIEFPKDDIFPFCERLVYGLGYDKGCDDYKLVRICQFYCGNPDFYDSEVKVYSLKMNSWRRVMDFPKEYFLSYKRVSGVFVNGCLHWVVSKNPESDGAKSIIAFDLGSGRCRIVSKPRALCGTCHINVDVLCGSLSVLVSHPEIRSEVWIMERYGVEGSWTKLFSIAYGSVLGNFEYVRALVCSSDGSRVLLQKDMKSLFWYDLRTQRAKRVNVHGLPDWFEAQMLVESLVPLDGYKKSKKKKPKRKRTELSEQADSLFTMLPEPLLLNIFSRLPADTLLQLTYVCKAWNNVINDPEFAKMHLEVSAKCNENLNFVLGHEKLHLIDFNKLNAAVQINHPLVYPKGWTCVLGACNGLLCLYNREKDLAIWNPLTGRCHKIPIKETKSPNSYDMHFYMYGFGFDSSSDDYKVVQIFQMHSFKGPSHDYFGSDSSDSESDICYGSEVQVYSLKDKCWRKIKCFPFTLSYVCPGVFVNGALYWVADAKRGMDGISNVILSFDLWSEECRVVPQPDYGNLNFHLSLWLFGGSLCILCHYPRLGVDIWVMEDYEMQTWCKLISITQPKPIKYFEYIKPLTYSKNGSEVLLELDYKKLIWYNLNKKTVRHVNISGLPESFDTEVFYKSLVDPGNLIPRQKKQSVQSCNFLAVFPEKLLSHVLSYLPIKTLLRFQCVCKKWYNLINDSEFIKMQLEVSSNCNSSSLLILGGEKLFSLDFQLLDGAMKVGAMKVIHSRVCPDGLTNIVGSSNGLVCLHKDSDIALWNPWTGKYERLPPANFRFHVSSGMYYCFIHGFGYDPTSNDYKVICILQLHNNLKGGSVHSEIHVYSLRSKSWGTTRKFPYIICYPCSGVLASGALHWVARQNPELYSSSNLLIAFDLGSEKCRVVTQPNYIDTDFHMSLGLLRNSLCLLCHYPKQSVDFWVMTEYGTESWTKLFSISQPKLIKQFEYLKPLGYSNDEAEVLLEQDNEKLLCYNLVKNTIRYVKVRGLPTSFEAVMTCGSLVQIGSPPKNFHEKAPNKSQSVKAKVRDGSDSFLAKGFKLKL